MPSSSLVEVEVEVEVGVEVEVRVEVEVGVEIEVEVYVNYFHGWVGCVEKSRIELTSAKLG